MNFFETLTAAINDLQEHGFDSVERVAMWTARLREAAKASLRPEPEAEAVLREGLAIVYRRLVEKGGIERYNPGVPRFTIDRVKPKLRAELDRRIVASANLIKRNREEAIEKTLHRFQGWATSVPLGGTDAPGRRETKQEIRKSLAQLDYRERVVAIDQGHKMLASLSEILAKDSNAIAGVWHSNYRQRGYNFREDHKERDGKIYMLRDNWAQQKGLVKVGPAGYYDEITAAGSEIMCRCTMRWLYNLKQLPPELVTNRGRAELERVRAQLRAGPLAAPGTFA